MKNTILFSFFLFCFSSLWAQNEGDCGVFSYQEMIIPDDQTMYHESSLDVSNGIGGETINSIEDLSSIWINMEHSFLADLVITVICPNGQSLTLHNQGGGGAQLGLPNQSDDEVPGTGWDYWWSATPNYGTLVEEANGASLPSGIYESVEPWTELLGCPVNGQWTLQFADMWASDNGYLFGWGIALDPSVVGGECQEILIPGCTDNSACNFDPNATIDDGSCLPSGCTNWDACNYDPDAECDDGSCQYPGCISVWACNYNPNAGCSDGSCVFPGCTDPDAENYDPFAGCDDGSCIFIEYGCTDEFACNYDPGAEEDNGSCEYTSCVEIEIIWLDLEYLCDTTIVSFYVANIEPNTAVVSLYNSIEQDDFIISLTEGATYEIPFTIVNGVTDINIFPLFVTLSPFSGENLVDTEMSFDIDESIEAPDVIELGNNVFYCTNCEEQDATIWGWILTLTDGEIWYFEETPVLYVPEGFEGTIEMCLTNLPSTCTACSEAIQITTSIQEQQSTRLIITSNGTSPVMVPNEKGELRVFDSSGKLVFQTIVSQGQRIETNHFATGLYQVILGEENHRMLISR